VLRTNLLPPASSPSPSPSSSAGGGGAASGGGLPVGVLKSALQKNVRLGRAEPAVRTARELLNKV
jgi:hypothetical protein